MDIDVAHSPGRAENHGFSASVPDAGTGAMENASFSAAMSASDIAFDNKQFKPDP